MELTRITFLALLALVAVLRVVELRISRRNQRRLAARGAVRAHDPSFRWMVALHAAVLAGAAVEVVMLRRPFLPVLAAVAGALFLGANALRWWVIATLGGQWNVEVMDARGAAVVTGGPYRWIRHPNYVAVFVEMFALPLIHTAWLTAALGSAAHLLVLRSRVRAEDAVLLANPDYRAQMGSKPRFLPRLVSGAATGKRSTVSGNSAR
jgi:methyltransferase